MKLVIDIPEEEYNEIITHNYGVYNALNIIKMVEYGTPLIEAESEEEKMQFRIKDDFIKCIKKLVTEMEKEEHVVMNSPHIIKETIKDEPRYIKKRLIIEWDVVDNSESEETE